MLQIKAAFFASWPAHQIIFLSRYHALWQLLLAVFWDYSWGGMSSEKTMDFDLISLFPTMTMEQGSFSDLNFKNAFLFRE